MKKCRRMWTNHCRPVCPYQPSWGKKKKRRGEKRGGRKGGDQPTHFAAAVQLLKPLPLRLSKKEEKKKKDKKRREKGE